MSLVSINYPAKTRFAGDVPPSWAMANESPAPEKVRVRPSRAKIKPPPAPRPYLTGWPAVQKKKSSMNVTETVKPAAKRHSKCAPMVDVSKLTIEDTPYDPKWKLATAKSMYDPLFTTLKDGQCIRAKTEECGAIANGMRTWFKKRGFIIDVSEVRKCPDGFGRVWLMSRKPIAQDAQA